MKFIIQVLTEENKQVGKVELKATNKSAARIEMAMWLYDKLLERLMGQHCQWYNGESVEIEFGHFEPWYSEPGWYDPRNNALVLADIDLVEGCDVVVIDYRKYMLVEIATPEQIG